MRNSMQLYTGRIFPHLRLIGEMEELLEAATPLWPPFHVSGPLSGDVTPDPDADFDLEESRDHFVLTLNMPGVKAQDLTMNLDRNTLMIVGQRKRRSFGNAADTHSFTSFQRRFTVPTGVDTGKIEAHLADGVLTILMPKTEQAKPRSIKIGSTPGGFFSKLLGQQTGGELSRETDPAQAN